MNLAILTLAMLGLTFSGETKPMGAVSGQWSAVSRPGVSQGVRAGWWQVLFGQTNPTMTTDAQAIADLRTQPVFRFEAVDVYIDSRGQRLAAYQVELMAESGVVKIVGIEGGEHAAFSEPPYYDPAALMNHRVILAAFSTGKDLPSGRTRMATIHVQVSGGGRPRYEVRLQTAGDPEGKSLSPLVGVEERVPSSTSTGPAGGRSLD